MAEYFLTLQKRDDGEMKTIVSQQITQYIYTKICMNLSEELECCLEHKNLEVGEF